MSHCLPKEVLTAVLNKKTGELMEYRHLIGNPKYRELWLADRHEQNATRRSRRLRRAPLLPTESL